VLARLIQAVLVGGLVSLAGCAAVQQPKEAEHTLSKEHHLLTGANILRSPELSLQNVKSTSNTDLNAHFQLTKLADTDSYCLYTSSSILGIGWSLFDTAQDAADDQLNVIKSKSDVRPDGIKEEDCIELTRTYLEQHRHSGLDIKLIASNRDIRFTVQAEDVQRFLDSVDRDTTADQ